MTREEEINIAVSRYIEENSISAISINKDSFIEGAKWSDEHPKSPWISVEDDLPCNHKELIITNCYYDGKETINVITINKRGVVNENFMIFYNNKWEWGFSTAPCYWMPIPELPKE